MATVRAEYLSSKALRSFLSIHDGEDQTVSPELDAVLAVMRKSHFSAGDRIVTEGCEGDSLFIIESGIADVMKESDGGVVIGTLKETDVFGELALFTGECRSATVLARTDVDAFKLSKEDFESLIDCFPQIMGTFLKKLYNRLAGSYKEMKVLNEQLSALNHLRSELASIFTSVVLVITAYTFILNLLNAGFLNTYEHAGMVKYISNRVIEAVTLFIVVRIIVRSGQPLQNFGLTFQGWQRQILEALGLSAAIAGGLLLFKWTALRYGLGIFSDDRLFSLRNLDWSYATYFVVAPLQEFIARGVIQGSLQRLLVGRRNVFWAVVITSFLFGSLHLFASQNLAIAAVVTSWVWGWMFARHRSLVGVGVSHFLVGNIAGLLGFWTIF
jgi:CRP-like cAMP-binding protein